MSSQDVDRRRFFRTVSREAIEGAANVIGVASAIRQEAADATANALGLRPAGSEGPVASVAGGATRYPAPYRLGTGVVRVVDQRRLPAETVEIECRSGEQVAFAIRDLAVRGGPVLGQLAAYGMALAAEQCAGLKAYPRSLLLQGTGDALRGARPDVEAVAGAVDRCLSAWLAIREPADGAEIAQAVRRVADAVAAESTGALEALCRHGAAFLQPPDGRPLEILTIDSTGPLSGGPWGTAVGVAALIAGAGRPVHVWVADSGPSGSGRRLASPELRGLGVPSTVIADSAVAWLLQERSVDVVLAGADRIAANGDVANATGTYQIAVLAAQHGIPVDVCAPMSAVDLTAAGGSDLTIVMRPATDLVGSDGDPDALVPLDDVTPAELVRAYITDQGVRQAPFIATAQPGRSPG